MVHNANLRSGKWVLVRDTELHPGRDGMARVVKRSYLKTYHYIITIVYNKISSDENQQQPKTLKIANIQPNKAHDKTSNRLITIAIALPTFIIISAAQSAHYLKSLKVNQVNYFTRFQK